MTEFAEQAQGNFEKRKTDFLTNYKQLIDDHKVDLFSYPAFVPDGEGGFKVIVRTDIVDTTDQPVKSPFSV